MRFNRERLTAVWDEILPLIEAHSKEVGIDLEFAPNRLVYENLERIESLVIFTMRDSVEIAMDRAAGVGLLIGYAVFTVFDNPLFRVRQAIQDGLYVVPGKRGYRSQRFLTWTDDELKKLGAHQVVRAVTRKLDYSPMLKKFGYEEMDRIFTRRF